MQFQISSYIILCIAIAIILITTIKVKPIKLLHTMIGLLLILIALDCFKKLTLTDKLLLIAIGILALFYSLLGTTILAKNDSSISNPASW